GFDRLAHLPGIAPHTELDVQALPLWTHGREAEHLYSLVLGARGLHGLDELAFARLEDKNRGFAPTVAVEQAAVLGVEYPLDHRPCHLRKARHEVVIAKRESRDAVDRIGDDAGALREFAHHQPLRRGLAGEPSANLALGIRMQPQGHSGGGRRALPRMVVRRRADAAEAEHDVLRRKAQPQACRDSLRLVAQIMGPRKTKPSLGEGFDDERQVLVLALPYEALIPDDESAERQASGCLLRPPLQVFQAADVLAVNEDLRNGAAAGDRADDTRAVAVVEFHFRVSIAELLEERFRLGAEAAAVARQDGDLVRLLRLGIDVVEHGVRVRHLERVTSLLWLDEHLLDHAVLNQHRIAPRALAEAEVGLVDEHAHLLGELAIAVGQQRHVAALLGARPLVHDESVVHGYADNAVHAVCQEGRRELV